MPEYKTPLLPPAPEAYAPVLIPGTLKVVLPSAPSPVPDGEDRSPWSRQSGENETEYAAFNDFLNQKRPRRLLAPGSVSKAESSRLFRKWRWAERAEAFDVWMQSVLDYEAGELLKQTALDRTNQFLAVWRDGMELVAMEFDRLRKRAESSTMDGTIKPETLVKMADFLYKVSRLENGESTSNEAVAYKPDLGRMSLDELREMHRLVEKMKATDDERPQPITIEYEVK